MNSTTAVFLWAAFNTMNTAILAGFTASGFIGGAGPAGAQGFIMYAIASTLIFLIGLVVWAGRGRRAGLRVPPRPAAAMMLALTVAVSWIGLALGAWVTYLAFVPLVAAVVMEFYPREHP